MPALSSISGRTPADNGGARHLAAIAFVDIAGYSILMSEDEVGTHRRWMALLANIVRPGAERTDRQVYR
jgi:class 3 adenylate cyclase